MTDTQQTDHKNPSGYVLDVPYTWCFFRYQSPVLLAYAARLNGFTPPALDQPFTYCDLGCGNGVSVNLMAAAFPHATFYGVDFNADHIKNARALAEKSNLSNVSFIDASFEELVKYELPKFDFITQHGVYSWVDAEIREQIHVVLDHFLKPGGLSYLCYNTLPGASNTIPVWKMMQTYTANLDSDVVTNARTALNAIVDVRDKGSSFFKENLAASRFLDKLQKRDARYLVHEICNGCYEPQYFWDVANDFQKLGLTFAGSAKLYRNKLPNIVSSRHFDHIKKPDTIIEQETRASFIRNESFRWDVFIRGQDQPNILDNEQHFDDIYFGANQPLSALSGKVGMGRRQINLDLDPYKTLVQVAASGQFTASQLYKHPDLKEFTQKEIIEGLHDLVAADCFQPCIKKASNNIPDTSAVYRFTSKVNLALIEDRLVPEGETYLCSPVNGSAIRLNFMNGMFAWAINGCNVSDARAKVEKRLRMMRPQDLAIRTSQKDFPTSEWIDNKAQIFTQEYLPRMLQLHILATD